MLSFSKNRANEMAERESYISDEPVDRLPIKRIFDYRHKRIREAVKLPKEFMFDSNEPEEVLLKIKMVGINFQTDFLPLMVMTSGLSSTVVPGSRIIGKVGFTSSKRNVYTSNENKFLIFPYSSCLSQDSSNVCLNCQKLLDQHITALSPETHIYFKSYPCLNDYIYGVTVDGGLQDFIKIKNPDNALIKVPEKISLHDCCFMLDIMLPFYAFVKDNFSTSNENHQIPKVESNGQMLIILNDVNKEMNDILIVVKYLSMDQNLITFMDNKRINSLNSKDMSLYESNFNHVFFFDVRKEAINFGLKCMISTGLEATRSRYNVVFFDQLRPDIYSENKELQLLHNDKSIHHFKLMQKDKLYAEQLLQILSDLNETTKNSIGDSNRETNGQSRPSVTSIETNNSSFSWASGNSHSTINSSASSPKIDDDPNKPRKCTRFRDDESIIGEPKQSRYFSWLWFDKDFELCHEGERSDDAPEDTEKIPRIHSSKHVNRLIKHPKSVSRVCYTNKINRPIKLNAFMV